eukprot:PhM_4_TR13967/c0_g1_i1/m.91665
MSCSATSPCSRQALRISARVLARNTPSPSPQLNSLCEQVLRQARRSSDTAWTLSEACDYLSLVHKHNPAFTASSTSTASIYVPPSPPQQHERQWQENLLSDESFIRGVLSAAGTLGNSVQLLEACPTAHASPLRRALTVQVQERLAAELSGSILHTAQGIETVVRALSCIVTSTSSGEDVAAAEAGRRGIDTVAGAITKYGESISIQALCRVVEATHGRSVLRPIRTAVHAVLWPRIAITGRYSVVNTFAPDVVLSLVKAFLTRGSGRSMISRVSMIVAATLPNALPLSTLRLLLTRIAGLRRRHDLLTTRLLRDWLPPHIQSLDKKEVACARLLYSRLATTAANQSNNSAHNANSYAILTALEARAAVLHNRGIGHWVRGSSTRFTAPSSSSASFTNVDVLITLLQSNKSVDRSKRIMMRVRALSSAWVPSDLATMLELSLAVLKSRHYATHAHYVYGFLARMACMIDEVTYSNNNNNHADGGGEDALSPLLVGPVLEVRNLLQQEGYVMLNKELDDEFHARCCHVVGHATTATTTHATSSVMNVLRLSDLGLSCLNFMPPQQRNDVSPLILHRIDTLLRDAHHIVPIAALHRAAVYVSRVTRCGADNVVVLLESIRTTLFRRLTSTTDGATGATMTPLCAFDPEKPLRENVSVLYHTVDMLGHIMMSGGNTGLEKHSSSRSVGVLLTYLDVALTELKDVAFDNSFWTTLGNIMTMMTGTKGGGASSQRGKTGDYSHLILLVSQHV